MGKNKFLRTAVTDEYRRIREKSWMILRFLTQMDKYYLLGKHSRSSLKKEINYEFCVIYVKSEIYIQNLREDDQL